MSTIFDRSERTTGNDHHFSYNPWVCDEANPGDADIPFIEITRYGSAFITPELATRLVHLAVTSGECKLPRNGKVLQHAVKYGLRILRQRAIARMLGKPLSSAELKTLETLKRVDNGFEGVETPQDNQDAS